MARDILKWLMLAILPVAIFLAGAQVMTTVTHREDVIAQIGKAENLDNRKPLNQRGLGYSKADVEQFWGALQSAGRNENRDFLGIERDFLEIDLFFPFAYVGALLACLLCAWVMLGRPFNRAWFIPPAAITAIADWTENFSQLALLRQFPNGDIDGSVTQIASWATVLKLYVGTGAFVFLFVLALIGIARTIRQSSGDSANRDKPSDFEAVLKTEVDAGCRPPGESLGLAFSGGGIRSATFNLGVIQALSELHLLRRFDYLSTISGGGFIGGWLSMFIRRRAGGDVARAEAQIVERQGPLEDGAIRFLRSFSNYLAPRVGFTGDTLTVVATYLRNLILNLSVLITLLAAAIIVPRVVVLGAQHLSDWAGFNHEYWFDLILVAMLAVTTFIVALNLFYRPLDKDERWPWYTRPVAVAGFVDLPVVAAALFTTCYYMHAAGSPQRAPIEAGGWMLSVVLVYVFLWVIGMVFARAYPTRSKQEFTRADPSSNRARWTLTFLISALIAGVLGGGLLYGVATAIAALNGSDLLWAATVLGPPAIIVVIMLMVVAHIGLMARKFTEGDRELWSTLGGGLLRIAVVWVIVFGIALYGPAAIGLADQWVAGAGGVAWIVSTLFGVFAGSSSATGKRDAKPWLEYLTRFAPHVFALGLLIVLSWGVHQVLACTDGNLPALACPDSNAGEGATTNQPGIYLRAAPDGDAPVVTVRKIDPPRRWDEFLAQARMEYPKLKAWFEPEAALPLIVAVLLLTGVFLSFRININLFSLHHFYHNRIARCYLGATNDNRRPHPLTGFDPADDVRLAELKNQKPLHILGTAINLNRGKQLAWQNRRAASFAFTPLHAGFQPASKQVTGGYRDTALYGKDSDGNPIQLGTVIAISGAAATPNQGFHTSPAVAFLLTVFNVRLGQWCGNTSRARAWRWRDPMLTLRYWLAELTGSADQETPFVSLSDGGHFENLGIYELVRRRCNLILASDAGADPKYAFDDLAEAMRKCYTDFGVEIRFRTKVDDIRPQNDGRPRTGDNAQADDKPGLRHYAIADIVYPGQTPAGTLIYWKSSLTENLPPDIMHYRRTHPEFPHEPTADQFFDESQFESYRHLGYEVAMRSITAIRENGQLPAALR